MCPTPSVRAKNGNARTVRISPTGEDTYEFVIHVSNTNDQPLFTNEGILEIDQNDTYDHTVTYADDDLASHVSSAGYSDSVEISVVGSLPSWLSLDADTFKLSGSPTNADVGTHNIHLRLTDASVAENNSSDQIFIVTVNNVNDYPVFIQALELGHLI